MAPGVVRDTERGCGREGEALRGAREQGAESVVGEAKVYFVVIWLRYGSLKPERERESGVSAT